MRGGFSAPRRPRSGFKESPQGCENEEAALNDLKRARERSRKERKALGSSSSSGRRNKRTRSGLGDQLLYRGSDEDDGYDTVEVSHGGSPTPSSHSRSEDDEEREANHRRPANTKLNNKSPKLSDDIIGVGLSSIPRKARSAFVKRAHESSPSAPPSDGIAVQPCIAAPSPSAKSGRRTKPPGTKPRPAKFAKVSASFSEREVEVAEVLFGFAKQFTSESCVEDANELKTSSPSSLPPSVVSPIQLSSSVSVSASPLPPPAEAPKRKRPRIAVRTEEVRSPASTIVEQPCQSTEMDNLPSNNTDALGGFTKGIAPPGPSTTPDSPQNHGDFVQVANPCLQSFQNHGLLDRKMNEKVMAPLPAENKAGVPEMVDGASELAGSQTETEGIDAPADMLRSGDSTEKVEPSKMSPLSSKTENTPMEKLDIDLMVSPQNETDSLDKEKGNDNGPNVVGNAGVEFSGRGTVGIDSVSELKAVAVKRVIAEEKRELGADEERENDDRKVEIRVERGIEQHCVKEEVAEENNAEVVWKERDKDLSKQLLQKVGKITKSDPRTQTPERSDVSSSLVSVPGNISGFPSEAESLPLSMAVAGWHGGLPTLGRYFGPSSATWPGASSLPGVMSVEGNSTLAPTMQPGFILQSQQAPKRCAAHAYIAHFIEYQKQLAHQPFWAATYGTSSALYGVKPYNLNIPLPPPTDNTLGGSALGTASASSVRNSGTACHNIMGSSSNDSSNVGQNLKEKVTATYMDALWKQPVQQQAAQRTFSTIIQHAPPFGFPVTESGASCSAAVNAGNGTAMTSRNSGSRPSFHGGDPTTSIGGTTEVNSSFASMASAAQAQYLAMLQHNGYPVPLPHAHFGATNTGAHNHLGHPQIFNGSFYATHLIHPPLHTQQQGQQNPNTTSGLSSTQKQQQQQFNFSSLQQQVPSNSPHHHLSLSPQSMQVENEGSKVVDSASSVDKKLPMAQKSFHVQGTSSNSNSSVTPSLLAASLPQDLTLMAGLGVKHAGKQQPVSMQHQGADPSLHMSWKGQQSNQNAKQAAGRSKTTTKSTASNYGDHVASVANHSNFQESGITTGQALKQQQQDQHSPQWKVPSTIITSGGAASQAVIAAAMRNLPQQGQYQSVNLNSMANSSGAAIPQSVFATSTKNYGQQTKNLHNNSGCLSASNTKSAGTPSKSVSGNKGSIPRPHRSVAPISAKKSSPNHLSQSPSSKSSQKQYEQHQRTSSQATVSGGSGQTAGSKNQQYYSQAHFNQQQSYQLQPALPHQIQQQLLFSQNQYIHQQAVQQSQLSAQSVQQAAALHQHPSMQGFNYSQPPFSNPHQQQEQQQQILPVSTSPSNPVCSETLSVGLPTLTLGSPSTGRGAAKIMPGGSHRDNGTVTGISHPQYSPHNGTVSARVHSTNSQAAIISSPYIQTVPIASRKVGEQNVGSDGLNQDGVLLLPNSVDLNMCAQTNASTLPVPSSSPRTMTGNLKKAQGGNIMESMPSRGGINLSAVSNGLAYQDLGASSGQTPPMSTNQHPASLAAGSISLAISTPLEAAASIVHP